jgi:hypothetical protein
MDHSDKWRQALGSDIYKSNSLNVDSSMRQRVTQFTAEMPITRQESDGVSHLLFKGGKGFLHDSWKQGFFFDEKLKYGFFQEKGGPCGVLATV